MPVIQPKPVTIDGVTYGSYAQAEKELGLSKGSISKRMAREKAQAEAELGGAAPTLTDAGPTHAQTDAQDDAKQSDQTRPPIGAADTLEHDSGQQAGLAESNCTAADGEEKSLVYDGVEYKTRKLMAEALDVDYLKLNAYLRKYDDVDEAVEKCLSGETSLSVNYNGTMFRSFKALCDTYNISPGLVRQTALFHEVDKLDAFDDLATLREVGRVNEDITLTFIPMCVLQGVPYRGAKDMAEQFGLDQYDLSMRIKSDGLVEALQHLQKMQTLAFHIDGDDGIVTMEDIAEELANSSEEHFEIHREDVPLYPRLQDIDIVMQCYDVEPVRDSIGSGQYSQEYQGEPEQGQEQEMY